MSRSFTSTDPVGHEGKTNVWLTPRWLLELLGPFNLDPAGHHGWNTAAVHYFDDGLSKVWKGRVWLNPPYGKHIGRWLNKLQAHGDGVALIFARTDTAWFQSLQPDAINFIKGRIRFLTPEKKEISNAGAPSCLLAYGKVNVEAISRVTGRILKP